MNKKENTMEKKIIAVLFEENSSEYEVSLQLESSVFENIKREKLKLKAYLSFFIVK